jgi:hypothetical protein
LLARVGKRAESWIALTNGIVGEGRALYRAVVDADLEGIVAKHLADAYHPKLARWHKILNRAYSAAYPSSLMVSRAARGLCQTTMTATQIAHGDLRQTSRGFAEAPVAAIISTIISDCDHGQR